MTQKTILNECHRRLGARMVDFGGWDMPLNYGSQIEEHQAVRQDCGMFDVSHMCAVDIAGRDAHAYLLRLLAGNVDKLTTIGKAFYCTMLNEHGGVVDDLICFYLRDGYYRLVINAGTAEKDIDWMRTKLAEWGLAVGIMVRRDLAIIAVQGPNAKARVWQLHPETRAATESLAPFFCAEVGDLFLSTTGYTGEDGFEIALPLAEAEAFWQKLLAIGVRPAGLAARDTLRLEAGMNLYGQDMDENVSPLNAGLAWTVDLKAPRDFVGKTALLTQGAQNVFLGLVLEDKGGVLRAHQKVYTAEGEGETTSGSFSPSLQKSIAFARLPLGAAAGQTVEVDIRGKRLKARLVKPGFVRFGKALV